MAGLGRLLAWAWVGSACAGWLPGVWVVVAQAWWWLATSCVVLGVALMWPPRVALREAGWGLLLLLVGVAGWIPRMPGTVTWSCQPLLWMLAGVAVVERWGWQPIRQAVIWWAWAQVALWPLSWFGVTLADEGWTGTLGRRAVLGVWLAFASLWSSGWRAWALAGFSLATGSLSGVLAIVRLLPIQWRHPLNWAGAVSVLVMTARWWGARLTERWEVWMQAVALVPTHWMAGWGLQQLPVGFQEAIWNPQIGTRWSPILDLHNTWLDVLVRGGAVGALCLLVVMGWAAWRSAQTQTWWTWLAACWAMTWQSVGAQPALMVVAMGWLASLCQPRRLYVA